MALHDVLIFDTTLRDGEQAPGNSLSPEEKLRLGRQLDALGVDILEAGFPAASEGDFRSVLQIATEIRRPVIAALARCHERDIELAGEALLLAQQSGTDKATVDALVTRARAYSALGRHDAASDDFERAATSLQDAPRAAPARAPAWSWPGAAGSARGWRPRCRRSCSAHTP